MVGHWWPSITLLFGKALEILFSHFSDSTIIDCHILKGGGSPVSHQVVYIVAWHIAVALYM